VLVTLKDTDPRMPEVFNRGCGQGRAVPDPAVGVLVKDADGPSDRGSRAFAIRRSMGWLPDDTHERTVGLLEPPGPPEGSFTSSFNSPRDVEGKVDLVLDQNPTGPQGKAFRKGALDE